MSERETRDFMSVDAFSQLPFIRPAPTREKPSSASSSSAIRLFGIEVPHEPDSEEDPSKDPNTTTNPISSSSSNGNGESGRKFECHYCCRHFPTSQALGGHQNAHKRERQHAKRAQFQSAMAAHHQSTAEGHMYGFVNYHRLGSVPPAARFGFDPPATHHYPSWNSPSTTSSSVGTRSYGGLGSANQPINGSPLPGLWRVPTVAHGSAGVGLVHRDRAAPLPLFGGDESRAMGGGGGSVGFSTNIGSFSSSSSAPPQSYESGVKENVSLDLHL